ncbi:MAG: SDR family NAD(P)-dependent oxidoreductase [Acidimicrobiia bacterium]|nr:SDR family NAD(P)-dependent oxidoreductase [Acidimicrobiia bacterium]MDX2466096.1 SDR family NAD(P)-dependent oxidoreductase [Acidimicrobiia bacterium]
MTSPSTPATTSRWDGLLESTVVGSFTSIGHRIRSRHWTPVDTDSLSGQVVVITGATSGIGMEVATMMASYGSRLRIVARNPEKAERLRNELISDSGNDDIRIYLADLSLMSEVERVADEILAGEPEIHVLVNNAVILPADRTMTSEGLELAHATNLVAPFLLTNALIPRLVTSAPARIINAISGGMYTQGLALDDLNSKEGEYHGSVAYARAKRGLMVLTKMWADQLAGTGVTVNATHPGWVNTPGVKDSLPGFHKVMGPLLRTTEQGADTVVWLASATVGGQQTGKLWHDREIRSEYKLKKTIETSSDRNELWKQLTETVAVVS